MYIEEVKLRDEDYYVEPNEEIAFQLPSDTDYRAFNYSTRSRTKEGTITTMNTHVGEEATFRDLMSATTRSGRGGNEAF